MKISDKVLNVYNRVWHGKDTQYQTIVSNTEANPSWNKSEEISNPCQIKKDLLISEMTYDSLSTDELDINETHIDDCRNLSNFTQHVFNKF